MSRVSLRVDIWVTPQELAEHWRVSRRTVYRLIEKGSLRYTRVGHQIRVNVEDALTHGKPYSEAGDAHYHDV